MTDLFKCEKPEDPQLFIDYSTAFGCKDNVIYLECSPTEGVEMVVTNGLVGEKKKVILRDWIGWDEVSRLRKIFDSAYNFYEYNNRINNLVED